MNKKLLNSKWTAVLPKNKEKHFIISRVKYDDNGLVTLCEIEAVYTKRCQLIDWRDLQDQTKWKVGWV